MYKLKSKFFFIFCALGMLTLSACDGQVDSMIENYNNKQDVISASEVRFKVSVQDGYKKVIVDTETRCQYLIITTVKGAGLTLLVDAEGKPLLYQGGL